MLTLILGGARSGKSRLAQQMAMHGGRVTYIATAQAGGDREMLARIEHHRTHRPADWQTIEECIALAEAVERSAETSSTVLVDCLTIWLSNLFWEQRDSTEKIEPLWRTNLGQIARTARNSRIILVSNDLGSGTVPEAAVTRAFRDSQGLLNQWTAELADEVILTVAAFPFF